MKKFLSSLMIAAALMMSLAAQAQTSVVVGTGTSTGYNAPFNNFYKNSWSQTIYAASEFNNTAGDITQIAYDCSATASFTFSTLKIYMGTTSSSIHASTSDWLPLNDLTLVYSATNIQAPSATGWWTINLDTPFYYDATENLVVCVSKTTSAYSSSLTFKYTSVTDSYLYRQNDSDLSYANHPGTAAGTKTANRANATFTVTPNNNVCPRPLTLTVDTVTRHDAVVSWAPADMTYEWDLAYGPAGFNPATGGTLVPGLTTTSYTIQGLNSGSDYEVCVRSVCDPNAQWYSSWKSVSFMTECDVITAGNLPYTEDFESYGTGAANPINQCWFKGTNGSTAYPYPYGTNPITGSRSLYFYAYYPSSATSTRIYSYVAMPALDTTLPASATTLRFNARRYQTTTQNYFTYFEVGVMSDPTDITTFTPVETFDLTDEPSLSIHNIEVDLMPYTGNGRHVAILFPYVTPTGSLTYTYNYGYIDDIELILSPSCRRPHNVAANSVSDTSAVITWSLADTTQNNFVVAYGPGTEPDSMPSVTASAPTATITGLTPGTKYNVFVKAVCSATDESEWSIVKSFRTLTTPFAVTPTNPFSYDFETPAANDWVLENGNCVNGWYIGQATSNGNTAGIQSMYISNDNGVTNDYSFTDAALVYAYKTFEFEAATYNFSYDWKAAGQTTLDFLRVALVPTTMTLNASDATALPAGFSATAMPEGWIPVDGNGKLNLNNAWTTHAEDVLIPAAGTYNLVFIWRNNNTTGTTPPAAIDNVVITRPSCPKPINFAIRHMTSSSVTLEWTAAGTEAEWAIRYKDITVPATAIWDTVNNVTTNPYTITGLTTGNTYQFEIQAVCGQETSPWEGPIETAVGVQTIEIGTGTSATYTPPFNLYYTNSWNEVIYPVTEFETPGYITKIAYYCSAQTSYTFSTLKIYMGKTPNATHPNTSSWLPFADLQLVYDHTNVSGPSATGWWTITLDTPYFYEADDNLVIATSKSASTTTSSLTFRYTSVTGSALYRQSSTASYSDYPTAAGTSSSYRPNITVTMLMPDSVCYSPTVSVDSLTTNGAYVSWVPADSVSLFDLAYGPTGFDPNTEGTLVQGLTSTSYSLTGLSSGSNYDVCVRTICGTNFYSGWKRVSFMTQCDVLRASDLPYTENFEAYGTGSSASISPCWYKGTNNSTAYPYPYATAAINGQRGLYFYGYYPSSSSSTPYYCYAALPELDTSLPANSLTLRFNYKRYSTTTDYYPNVLQVGVMTNPNNVNTFVPVETVNISSAPAGSINNIEVNLYGYTGTGRYVAIYCPSVTPTGSATYTYNYSYIDDIELIESPSCLRPRDLTFTNVTTNTADVSWTLVDTTQNNFVVAYGTGTDPDSMMTVTSTVPSVTLTGLAEATVYNVFVKAICSATDESEWSVKGMFCTTQTPFVVTQTTPFVEDFETAPAWMIENGGMTNHWVIDTNANNGGSYSLYITDDDSLKTNSYTITSAGVVFAYRTLSLQQGVYDVSYDWRAYGEGSYDYIRVALVPAGEMLTAGTMPTGLGTTTTPDTWIALDGGEKLNLNSAWTTHTGDATVLNSGIYNLVFVWRNDGSGGTMPPAAVDNISVVRPACSKPLNLHLASFTSSAFTFQWTPGGTETMWNFRYKYSSADTTSWTVVTGLTDTTYVLNNLAPVNYDFAVQADCGNGMTSAWTSSISILPGAIEIGQGAEYAYLPFYGLYGYSYSQQIYKPSEINASGLIMSVDFYCTTLPAAGKTGAVRIWMGHTTKNNFANNTDYVDVNTLTDVYFMGAGVEWSDIHLGWNTFELDQPFVYNGTDNLVIAYYEGYPGYSTSKFLSHSTTSNLSIMHYSDTESNVSYTSPATASGTKSFALYRNDIRLVVVPNDGSYCFKPKSLTVITSDTSNVQVAWSSDVMQHEIVWGPHNFSFSNGTTVLVNDTTYTFTGLTSSSMYDMYVKAICSDSSQSFYTGPLTFYTAQTPAPLPYSCGFEPSDPESSKWVLENGNQINQWFIGTDMYGYGRYSGQGGLYVTYDIEGAPLGMMNYYNMTSASKVYAFRTFDLEAGPHVVSFKWKCMGQENYDYIRAFLAPASAVLAAGNNAGITYSATPTGWIALGGQLSNDTAWNTYYNEEVIVPVDGYYNLVFYWENNASSGNYPAPAIDNVQLFALTCPLPSNVHSTAADISTATIAWNEEGSATEWNIEYGTHGFVQGNGTVVSANTNPFTITGLNSATMYDVYVQSVCGPNDVSGWRGPATFNTATCLAYEMCTIHLELNDQVLDGWNGAQLEVYTNGIYINSFTINQGSNHQEYDVPLCPGQISLKWRKGSFDNECSFTVYSNDNVMLFSSPACDNYSDGQTVFEFAHTCNNATCPAPTGVTATQTENVVHVAWTASTDAASYNIYRNNTKIVSNITVTSYNDNTIVNNGEYCYKVTANCNDGYESAPSDDACLQTNIGVGENAAEAARIFPNPTNNKVKVEAMGMTRVDVMSIIGQVVYTTDLEADEFEFDFGSYEAGVYMIRIETTTGNATKRVTVVK